MNGYLWFYERNGWRNVVSSPVNGLQDIECNQILNTTYLNPPLHCHIPKPPKGVCMPEKVLSPLDIKPFPVLWHEDNGACHQQSRERPPVPGPLSGAQLGEAAHRLIKNTLNLKPNHNHSGSLEQTSRGKSLSNPVIKRPGAARTSGYGTGLIKDPTPSYGNHNHPRAIMGNPRFVLSPYELQGDKHNFKTQNRYAHQEQQRNLRAEMSALTIKVDRTRPHASMSRRMPNSGQIPNIWKQIVQNIGPLPSPPPKWITRPFVRNTGVFCKQQQTSSAATHEKKVKKVYQVKSQESPPESA